MRVAFADDSLTIRLQLAVTIRNAGFEPIPRVHPTPKQIAERDIFGASDGKELLALCTAERPDVVLIDLSMGAHGGKPAAEAIAQQGLARQIVVVSSVSAEADKLARALGCLKLNKPYDKKVLAALLERLSKGV
jgi:CheY-like chemotaxis protein